MKKGYKYRIYPNHTQSKILSCIFGCARFVYNNSINFDSEIYKKEKKSTSKNNLIKRIAQIKNEFPWLKEVPSQPLQQAVRHYFDAKSRFFKNVKNGAIPGFPAFKSKYDDQSVSFPQSVKIINKKEIWLPKFSKKYGNIKITLHREIPKGATINTCTISKTRDGKYYVSFTVDDGLEKPVKPPITENSKIIGIDLGVKTFATTSDGCKYNLTLELNKSLKKLERLQRNLSRKSKGSKNRNKARLRVARLHKRIANRRIDNLHKLSKTIIIENQVIIVENLDVRAMVRQSVRSLARSIYDASWGRFKEMLCYKAEFYGRHLFKVNPSNTSKTCSNCLEINENLTLDIREWQCKHCHSEHDRDKNASKNVLRIGQELPEYQKALKESMIDKSIIDSTIGSSFL